MPPRGGVPPTRRLPSHRPGRSRPSAAGGSAAFCLLRRVRGLPDRVGERALARRQMSRQTGPPSGSLPLGDRWSLRPGGPPRPGPGGPKASLRLGRGCRRVRREPRGAAAAARRLDSLPVPEPGSGGRRDAEIHVCAFVCLLLSVCSRRTQTPSEQGFPTAGG